MERDLQLRIIHDLSSEIVLLTGPGKCGKTTLSKQIYLDFDYFNYDSSEDRIAIVGKSGEY